MYMLIISTPYAYYEYRLLAGPHKRLSAHMLHMPAVCTHPDSATYPPTGWMSLGRFTPCELGS